MAASAKVIAVKGKSANLIRYEAQSGFLIRENIGTNSQARTIESVQSIQRSELQD